MTRRAHSIVAALLVLFAFSGLRVWSDTSVQSGPVEADTARLESVLEESRADRSVDSVDWSDWIAHVAARALSRIAGGISDGMDRLPLSERALRIAARVLIGAVILLAVFLLARYVRRRLARREPDAAPETADRVAAPERSRDAAWWRAELERQLESGDPGPALESLWWWLAGTIAGREADPSWTNRELMQRSGRKDLAPQLGRLDAFTYGHDAPEPGALRALVAELDGKLA